MGITESTKTIDSLINLVKSNDLGLINMAFLLIKKELKEVPDWLKYCSLSIYSNELYLLKSNEGYYIFNNKLEHILMGEYHIFMKNINGSPTPFIMDTTTRKVYDLCFKYLLTTPKLFNVKSNIIFKCHDEWCFAETIKDKGELIIYDRCGQVVFKKEIPKSYFIVSCENGKIRLGGLRNGGFKKIKIPKFNH